MVSLLLVCGVILLFAPETGKAAMAENWVEHRNGKLSMAFDRTPVEIVVEAIRAKTGIRVSLPVVRGKLISVRVAPFPIEEAMSHFLEGLGFESIAMIYDDHGQVRDLIVLGRAMNEPASSAPNQPQVVAGIPSQKVMSERRPRPVEEDPPLTRKLRQRLREIFPPR